MPSYTRAAVGVMQANLDSRDVQPFLGQLFYERFIERDVMSSQRIQPLAGAGLFIATARAYPGVLQSALNPFHGTRQQSNLTRMKRDRDGPRFLVADDVDDGPVAIEDRDPGHFTLSHFVVRRAQVSG